jgi:arylsulfatase A-like enzyme
MFLNNLQLKPMNMDSKLFLLSLAIGFASCSQKAVPDMDSRPNLLFVFPDQMRSQTLGFLGKEPVMTPHLDDFANESLVFTHAISNAPVCSPYRAMLFSGKYPLSNGVLSNATSYAGEYGIQLKENEICWSDVLKENGYSLGYIGKWHLDAPHEPYIDCKNNRGDMKWNEWCPPERRHGFDFWYAYGTYDYHMHPLYWSTHAARDSFHFVDQWGPEHEADMAIKFIHNEGGNYRDDEKPFALVVSMNPPHMPYDQLPDRYVRMYDSLDGAIANLFSQPSVPDTSNRWGKYYRRHIKNQLAMVTGVDEQFGRILSALAEKGLDNRTIVVFTSDHGDCLGKHEKISKTNPYEESVSIPFLVRWTGKIRPGSDDLLLSVPDVYPTLLDLMGLAAEIPDEVEGQSYAGILLGRETVRPTSQLYFMVRRSYSKTANDFYDPAQGDRGVRTHQYTLYMHQSKDSTEVSLWDRFTDPYQMKNIAAEQPDLVDSLFEHELKPWMQKTNDPWLGNWE